jgi:hypothetical protein
MRKVLTRMALDIALGVAIGALFWGAALMLAGKSIRAGLRGEVEDGLNQLQCLTSLGAFIGSLIGVVHGIRASNRESRP